MCHTAKWEAFARKNKFTQPRVACFMAFRGVRDGDTRSSPKKGDPADDPLNSLTLRSWGGSDHAPCWRASFFSHWDIHLGMFGRSSIGNYVWFFPEGKHHGRKEGRKGLLQN